MGLYGKKKEILVVPCDDFGVKGYVRIAYCTDKKKVLGALPGFKAAQPMVYAGIYPADGAKYNETKEYVLDLHLHSDNTFMVASTANDDSFRHFGNWEVKEDYRMTREGELLRYTLQAWSGVKLKVFDNQTQAWMGAECLGADTTAPYETDGHTNICLPAGTWKILYDPTTKQITVQ